MQMGKCQVAREFLIKPVLKILIFWTLIALIFLVFNFYALFSF